MNPFMRMQLANKGKGDGIRADASTIWIYDVIAGDSEEAAWFGGISPDQFIKALSQTTGPVTLRINSPGGSVFGAQAMVSAMRAHPAPITARVDSLAASAASVIACEAATLEIVQGGMLMVHKAWGMAVGNEADMRDTADLLAKIDGQIAATYARRAEGDVEEWLATMAAETWFDAAEAVAAGLADRVIDENLQRPAAQWDLSAYAAAPVIEPEAEPAPVEEPKDLRPARTRQLAARLVASPI